MKKKIVVLLVLLILATMLVPASAAVLGAEKEKMSTGKTSAELIKSLDAAEETLLKYNEKFEWFDELFSAEFAAFARDFMFGDKYEDAFRELAEYLLVREFFANYLALVDGRTEDEMEWIKEELCSRGLGYVAAEENEKVSLMEAQKVGSNQSSRSLNYNVGAAVQYAWDNALVTTNVPYYSGLFEGDCTNFVSMCLKNGGLQYTYPPTIPLGEIYETTSYWYCGVDNMQGYTRVSVSLSHIRVGPFRDYWNDDVEWAWVSTKAAAYEVAQLGDIILLVSSEGSFYHSIIITGKDAEWRDLIYCGHTTNRLDASFNQEVSDYDTYYILQFSRL